MVVIGIGNGAAHDDAIGLDVARRVSARRPPPGVRVVELDGEPSRLIDAWDGAELAVVIDAARSTEVEPITVIDGLRDSLPDDDGRSSHGLGLAAAIGLGARLGRTPERLLVVAVRGERFEPGFGLSAAARRHAERAARTVTELVGGRQSASASIVVTGTST